MKIFLLPAFINRIFVKLKLRKWAPDCLSGLIYWRRNGKVILNNTYFRDIFYGENPTAVYYNRALSKDENVKLTKYMNMWQNKNEN